MILNKILPSRRGERAEAKTLLKLTVKGICLRSSKKPSLVRESLRIHTVRARSSAIGIGNVARFISATLILPDRKINKKVTTDN
jgi:hypothetical protein